jgi:pyridoxine/pyridoxamine 5'-phosphate oxidase
MGASTRVRVAGKVSSIDNGEFNFLWEVDFYDSAIGGVNSKSERELVSRNSSDYRAKTFHVSISKVGWDSLKTGEKIVS